jgi:hypothetical protein
MALNQYRVQVADAGGALFFRTKEEAQAFIDEQQACGNTKFFGAQVEDLGNPLMKVRDFLLGTRYE